MNVVALPARVIDAVALRVQGPMRISGLPIRIRLTLPFALAVAAVLMALDGFVYIRVGSALLQSTDQTLLAQATEATLRVENGKPLVDRDATAGPRR